MFILPYTAGYLIWGTSGEAKPAVANGSVFFEVDTAKEFRRTAGNWVEQSDSAYALASRFASSVYTPTLTNVANLDGSAAFECQYMRIDTTVSVSGKVTIDPTNPAVLTQLGITLPVASNFGAAEDCAGVAFSSSIAGQGAAIVADIANDRAMMEWISSDVTSQPMFFTFMYQVITP